ncbi:hypothetical protein [Mameliella sp.]|uniref:hypothetical protein n=1 Tax=Mameliella sp. TaxID=1924940 RepID=UPI003B5138DB
MKKIIVLLALWPSLGAAQDAGLDLNLFDINATHQPPPWAAGVSDPERLQALTRTQIIDTQLGDGSALYGYDVVPEEDSFSDPSQLYRIMGQDKRPGPPQGYLNGEINKYGAACTDAVLQDLIKSETRAMALLFCSSLKEMPDKGEIAIVDMNRLAGSDTLVMQFYQVWGPSFEVSDQASWPASPEHLQAAIQSLTNLALSRVD